MKVDISDKELLKLYKEGKSNKLKLPDDIIKKFFMRIRSIESAIDIYDFRDEPSIRFEKLEGYENRFSMRLNNKYRLEMEIIWENENKTLGTFYILKISKHYK